MAKQFIYSRLKPITILLVIVLGLFEGSMAFAKQSKEIKQTGDASLKNGEVGQTQQDQTILAQKAKMWGLTVDEYKQYLKEMADTPSGHWWKNLDPPQVLGMNAKTETARMKYARLDVQLDQARASKEIAFQHAYDKAFANNYPNAKPIRANASQSIQRRVVQSNDRFYLFTTVNDPEGARLADKMIYLLQSERTASLNIFFVGKASFSAIQRWAKANNIPRDMSEDGQITLNHNKKGSNNMLKRVLKTTKTPLPVLVRVRNGRSRVIALTSLLGK